MIYNFDALSFQILTIARFSHKNGYFCVKERPFAALSLRVSGTGQFKIEGKHLSVKPGDVLFIPGDTPYEVEYSVSESIVIHLHDCNYREAEVFCPKDSAEILAAFSGLLEGWRSNRSANGAKAGVYGILEKMESERKTPTEDPAFEKCIRYIERHFCDPTLDIRAVCDEGFISVSSLQRAFLRHFGISPMQYVIKLRMDKALKLLAENKRSIKEIAALCGFSDEKYFSRAFKGKYGYPPSDMRDHILP